MMNSSKETVSQPGTLKNAEETGPKRRGPVGPQDKDFPKAAGFGRWLVESLTALNATSPTKRTWTEVARRAGLSSQAISLWLTGVVGRSGQVRGIERETVRALAQATLPDGADADTLRAHANRGMLANGMLPDPGPAGCIVVFRENEPPQYVDDASALPLQLGSTLVLPDGTRLEVTFSLIRRLQFEAQLETAT